MMIRLYTPLQRIGILAALTLASRCAVAAAVETAMLIAR